jgi:transglutaminase-like putative cysteine protease
MNYRITHITTYSYASPVSLSHNLVLLTPRDGARVACAYHRLTVRPTPRFSHRRRDFFGNHVHTFSIEDTHRQLSITAASRVSVRGTALPDPDESPDWNRVAAEIADQTDPRWMSICPFVFDSPRISRTAELTEYAAKSFADGRPVVAAAADLAARIHRDFAYDKTATHVNTRTEDAFRLRRGVCQDFAHIMVACLRTVGLPARYVSGYLRTSPPPGKPRLVGADQSHAWASVYAGADLGWVAIDPTNNCLCSTDHVPIAWGRDYGDVVPIRGVFLGGGDHTLYVSVDVQPLDAQEPVMPADPAEDLARKSSEPE